MNQQTAISYEEMRSLVIRALSLPCDNDSLQINTMRSLVASVMIETYGIVPDDNGASGIYKGGGNRHFLSESEFVRVTSIIWDLIIEGVVRPGHERQGDMALPFFYVTEWGKERIKDNRTPYDPDGYLKAIGAEVRDVDQVITAYLTESLHTFRIGCLLSSTITLGCAAEKALLLLIDAYRDALSPGPREKFQKAIEGQFIKRLYDEFRKRYDSYLKDKLPGNVNESLDIALVSVFEMLRTNRNDAGHPTGNIVRREVAYASLNVFPTYLKKVYELIGWLKANSPLT